MVHLGPGVQYVAEGGRAYFSPSNPQDVIEAKKIVSYCFFILVYKNQNLKNVRSYN